MDILFKILYILLAIIILLVMIVIHEFGHYISGKILKFKINEFSVGFGPKLLQKKKKDGELFTLRAIPLGGYCAFEGEDVDNEDKNSKSFNNEAPWKRIIVLFSGAFFNLISAVIFSFIFILVIGYAVPVVSEVYSANSIPYNSILLEDEIIAVNGKKITVMKTFDEMVADCKLGDKITITVIRDSKEIELKDIEKKTVTYYDEESKKEKTYEGFGMKSSRVYKKASFGSALLYSVPYTGKMAWTILGTFGQLLTWKIPITSLSGPIGTATQVADLAIQNWRNILILLPLIASNLAVFNLLPIPALDGSKILLTTIEWIRRKPLKRSIENVIHLVGIVAIFGLVIVLDIIGIFT